MIKLTTPKGNAICQWQDWSRPKKDYQWVSGRSAMELAKSWFRNERLSPPSELSSLLESDRRFQNIKFVHGIPELVTSLPEKGEGRNHDLWISGLTDIEKVTICVEAKADEPFGNDTVLSYRKSSLARRSKGTSTRVPERIDKLVELTGLPLSVWEPIRYQLLTALCGTLIQAKKDESKVAVFIFHEFETALTTKEKMDENNNEYQKLLGIFKLNSPKQSLSTPVLIGDIDCYFAKIRTVVK